MSSRSRHLTDFNIAGMRYWDGASVLGELGAGERLDLVAEPDNPADPYAVAIYRKHVKLGYVPQADSELPAQMLYFGHADVLECLILKVDERADPWKQVRVGIYIADKRVEG